MRDIIKATTSPIVQNKENHQTASVTEIFPLRLRGLPFAMCTVEDIQAFFSPLFVDIKGGPIVVRPNWWNDLT